MGRAQEPRGADTRSFRQWRRTRPFWGGLFMTLTGLELFLSANLDLFDLKLHFGPQGFLSYVLPALMLLCGILTWLTPANRIFLGVVGLLTTVYSIIGLNLGGFLCGIPLGIIGGALTLAWGPPRQAPPTPASDTVPDDGGPAVGLSDLTERGDEHAGRAYEPGGMSADSTTELPLAPATEEPPSGPQGRHRPLFAILVTAMLLGASGLVLSRHSAALAAETPAPSCPASANARQARGTAARGATPRHTTKTAPKTAPKHATKPPVKKHATKPVQAPAAPPAAPSAKPQAGTKAALPWTPLMDLLTRLIPIPGGTPEPTPTGSPQPSAPPTADTPPAPPVPPTQPTPPRVTPKPSAPAPEASATSSDVPCLGPRVQRTAPAADDAPRVSVEGSTLTGSSLTMLNSTYDGVTELRTVKGSVRVLQFSIDTTINQPFKLDIAEAGPHSTVITSTKLTTSGHVKFYTPKFTGRLFGIFPVTFTPESPPPLTLPVLTFTDVKITLTLVQCDTLNADNLGITPT